MSSGISVKVILGIQFSEMDIQDLRIERQKNGPKNTLKLKDHSSYI